MTLDQLSLHASAQVLAIEDGQPGDAVARRLRELGFVAGEPLRLLARGPFAAEPLLVQIGQTRFALRLAEAARVRVIREEAA